MSEYLEPGTPEFDEALKKIRGLEEKARAAREAGEDYTPFWDEACALRLQTGIVEQAPEDADLDD